MAAGITSLRFQVERLVGSTRDDTMRVRFIERARIGSTRRLCLRIDWPQGSLPLFFFLHADGTWHLFPPEQSRPEMGVIHKAT
ncbi:hypothetical protein AWB74_03384 [Caballeronia arvi]|uniref:Uncharacterized protein n=1 Tax=Caballeronia arvi TaxID=1777135 RepID=A0A158J5P6_9BURK|nr:hypothetical protein [Caballeronia arvi]SAL63651.1 hypothetical protein AWB74_03384 [Caballeronia arvi]